MWTSLCNFLCNKFFHRPEIDYQRSNDSSYNGIYGKRLKLFDSIWDSTALLNDSKSCSMQKENIDISDDEEDCKIIAEIPRRKKAGNSVTINNFPEPSTTANNCQDHRFCSTFMCKTSQKSEDDTKDIEVIKYFGKSIKSINNKLQVKKFFNSPRCCISQGKLIKSRFSFKNQLRRKMNFLQESYRLTEKFQYIQLLQSHAIFNSFALRSPSKSITCGDKEIEIIDISDEKKVKDELEDQDIQIAAEVPGIRSFQDILKLKPLNAEVIIKDIPSDVNKTSADEKQLPENSFTLRNFKDADQKTDALEEKLRSYMQITSHEVQEVEVEKNAEPYYLPELTNEQEKKIKNALILEPKQEVLSEGFGLKITRQDMQTLVGLNWLNDEIINFYMNLIMERNKRNKGLPKVYAFNTFFFPKLASDGYMSLKRWTKQVDIFSFDIILVPIHLGMHWCLSVIDFRHKSVKYYDSIGSPNNMCFEKLLSYLKAESLDKRKKVFFTIDWKTTNVENIPQQMNGSDCGVFSCMFAEHLARDCTILFTQDDMPYFRKKMVIEILEKKLLT